MPTVTIPRALELARAHLSAGRLDEAESVCRSILGAAPGTHEAYRLLGGVAYHQGKHAEAEAMVRQAIALRPQVADYQSNLSAVLDAQGRYREAEEAARTALALDPRSADSASNLAKALLAQGRLKQAEEAAHRALALRPGFPEAANNLGNALQGQGQLSAAIEAYQAALAAQPHHAHALNNLGNALRDQGRVSEAIEAYRQALSLRPDFALAHSNLLLAEQNVPGVTRSHLARLHAEWNDRHAAAWAGLPAPPATAPDKKLRLGFVSPDLGRHAVGSFFVRVLESLRTDLCETFCYSDRVQKDDMTARIQAAAGGWCESIELSDEALAARIRDDRIDVLVDLAGHTARHRLLVFARRPAPVQVTWLGYVGTTGLAAMDYLLADRSLVPDGAEGDYRERVLRMPDGYACFDPPAGGPEVSPLPARERGRVTFGSFNNPAKINPQVIAVWAEILRQVAEARIVLKYNGLDDEGTARRFRQLFQQEGIGADRVALHGWVVRGALAMYHQIDVALDPFPYTGSTTTCDALWMGVPVVTWPGDTFASRQSLSHLSAVGLTELAASDRSDYVKLAVGLATDLDRLAEYRKSLRERMAGSVLCNGPRFARNLLAVLRGTWRQACQQQDGRQAGTKPSPAV